jgi:hypothetical protein
MSLLNSNFHGFDGLENVGLLGDAIANASERRNICANEDNSLPEILAKEATSVIGGLPIVSVFKPPVTIGLIANNPNLMN